MAIFRELADKDPGSEKKCGIMVYGRRHSGESGIWGAGRWVEQAGGRIRGIGGSVVGLNSWWPNSGNRRERPSVGQAEVEYRGIWGLWRQCFGHCWEGVGRGDGVVGLNSWWLNSWNRRERSSVGQAEGEYRGIWDLWRHCFGHCWEGVGRGDGVVGLNSWRPNGGSVRVLGKRKWKIGESGASGSNFLGNCWKGVGRGD